MKGSFKSHPPVVVVGKARPTSNFGVDALKPKIAEIEIMRRDRDEMISALARMRAHIEKTPEDQREKLNDEAGILQATINKLAEIITALEQKLRSSVQ